jgi:EmrB/QacA subfamily drug resistance transporter
MAGRTNEGRPVTERRQRIRERLEAKGTYSRWVLIAALAGMFATSFPVTILSVSLTDIADEFDTTVSVLSWVITLPMILSALCLPILGKLGDLHGHRKVFLTGFTLATGVSALTALAWDPLSLIGFRTIAQVIGGATQPTSMALVMLVFAPEDRVKAIGYWTFVAAGAPAIGLALGGPMVDLVGWRLIFVVQACLSLGALLLAAVILPDGERRPARFDIAGALSLSLLVGALMLAVRQSTEWGLGHPAVISGFILLPIATALFVWAERRAVAPLVPLEFLAHRNFTFALLTSLFMGAVYMGGFVLAPLALRDAFGLSATAAASVMLLRTGVFSVSSPLGGQLGARHGTRRMAVIGTAFLAVSMCVFVVGTELDMLIVFCIALVAQGLGNGIARPPVTAALANAVPETDLGMASALQRMTQQIGNSFGIAILTAVYDGSGTASSFGPPFMIGVGLSAVAVIFASFLREDVERRPLHRHVESEDPEFEIDAEFEREADERSGDQPEVRAAPR